MLMRTVAEGALPFDPLVPNAETIEAMKAARRGDLVTVGSVGDLMADLHADDEAHRSFQAGLQARSQGAISSDARPRSAGCGRASGGRCPLPEKCRDHGLTGEWQDHRDCHIRPDLVLIYRKPDDEALNWSGSAPTAS